MNCEEVVKMMDAYLDAELDPMTSQSIEQHLRNCPQCEPAYAAHGKLAHAIRSSATYYTAPPELRGQVQSALRNQIAAHARDNVAPQRGLTAVKEKTPRAALFETPWNWLALAAAILLTALISWNLGPRSRQREGDQFLATQLIASHVRSLMASHLTDVVSSDQHTVKPWLDEKLDFAAPVADLATDGFPLVGGRLDYLENRPVAALVYQRRKHFINLFIWLAEPGKEGTTQTITRQGYQLLHWTDSDFNYWAVSDVNANDLQTFKNLFEKQLARK